MNITDECNMYNTVAMFWKFLAKFLNEIDNSPLICKKASCQIHKYKTWVNTKIMHEKEKVFYSFWVYTVS